MYYIQLNRNEFGNHGNPQSYFVEGMIELPDNLIQDYIATKGFANLTVEDDQITHVELNQTAFDNYLQQYPDVESQPSEFEDFASMIIDHEYRLTLMELGEL